MSPDLLDSVRTVDRRASSEHPSTRPLHLAALDAGSNLTSFGPMRPVDLCAKHLRERGRRAREQLAGVRMPRFEEQDRDVRVLAQPISPQSAPTLISQEEENAPGREDAATAASADDYHVKLPLASHRARLRRSASLGQVTVSWVPRGTLNPPHDRRDVAQYRNADERREDGRREVVHRRRFKLAQASLHRGSSVRLRVKVRERAQEGPRSVGRDGDPAGPATRSRRELLDGQRGWHGGWQRLDARNIC